MLFTFLIKRENTDFKSIPSCCSKWLNNDDDRALSIWIHSLHLADSTFPFYLISAEQSGWVVFHIYFYTTCLWSSCLHSWHVYVLSFWRLSVLSACFGQLSIFCVIVNSSFPWQTSTRTQHPRESTELSQRNALHNLNCCRSTQDSVF